MTLKYNLKNTVNGMNAKGLRTNGKMVDAEVLPQRSSVHAGFHTHGLKRAVQKLLDIAGVKIDGMNPWDIQVNNEDVYAKILSQGTFGLGEAYMDGWWDCKKLDEFFYRVVSAGLEEYVKRNYKLFFRVMAAMIFNLQSKTRAFRVGEQHYDLGNDLYKIMLDRRMTYTCGYWVDAADLDKAQENKIELICKKLDLRAGMKILDIGCGWGSFAKYAAENYGVEVVGITISREQAGLAKELCTDLPISIELKDYRDINEKFDRIVSIGMFEHVGYKNFETYFKIAHKNLKDSGLFLLHTIGSNKSVVTADPWIEKFIFPNGMIPSIKQIGKAIEGLFVMEDWHNFGADYDKTLMTWCSNFEKNWSKIKSGYDERFYRMWRYYLLSSAGVFRARDLQLWQVVLSKKGIPGGYKSVRN